MPKVLGCGSQDPHSFFDFTGITGRTDRDNLVMFPVLVYNKPQSVFAKKSRN